MPNIERTIENQRASIRRSIARSILVTTLIALAISSAASVALEIHRYRESAETSIQGLANVVGIYSQAALEFADEVAGEEALAALSLEESIVAAAIFDVKRNVFASYERVGTKTPTPVALGAEGVSYVNDTLEYTEPVLADGQVVGYVYLRKSLATLEAAIWQSVGTMAGVTLLALLLASIAASRLREQIAGPLEEVARSAAAMERGDLSVAAAVHRSDEIGALANAFNRTREGLGLLVAQVRSNSLAIGEDARILSEESESLSEQARLQQAKVVETSSSVERVGASAREVRDTVDAIAATATETSSSVTELDATARRIDEHMDTLFDTVDGSASSISEMSAAVRQIATNADSVGSATHATTSSIQVLRESVKAVEANAKQCETLSKKVSESADHGGNVVGQVIGGMEQIHGSFQGLEGIVNDLALRSEAIDEVVKVIEAVVAETNLLALNASIISSHAGEHGRAFAVVAQEVKNLADRTAGSTREIAEAMEAVRSGIGNAVTAVGSGAQVVKRGVGLSEEAGSALEMIRESAGQSSEMVAAIVRATEAQSTDIDTVDSAMQDLNEGVSQIRVGTHEQDKVASELLDGVEQLRQLAREVKVATSEQSRQSGHMARAVEEVADGVNQILSSAEHQHRDIESIVAALGVFRENTVESSRRADALRQCVESLSARAAQLEAGVGRFTV